MRFMPQTSADISAMLAKIGISSVEDLFAEIPESVRLRRPLNLPEPMSEPALLREMRRLAGASADLDEYISFMGAGVYDHFIPAALRSILSRQEFVTAYTPYQPEVSQGVLQSIFEYQSMICSLTGMDVANASMYDGATAMAEAATMCVSQTRRNTILISETVNPEFRAVLETYAWARDYRVVTAPSMDGRTDADAIRGLMDGDTACVIVQTPNFYGIIEKLDVFAEIAHAGKALAVAVVNPVSMGILESPARLGIDIVVGEGQSLGNTPSYGGPLLGFLACRDALVRRLPGRIVGMTHDHDGRRGFVLTLQTREQHIRREKATSNICSNQALNALAACVYLALIGKEGLRDVATQCLNRAHYAAGRIARIPGFTLKYPDAPFFHEFVVETPIPAAQVVQKLAERKILAGVPLDRLVKGAGHSLLVAVTESRTKEDIDALVSGLEGLK